MARNRVVSFAVGPHPPNAPMVTIDEPGADRSDVVGPAQANVASPKSSARSPEVHAGRSDAHDELRVRVFTVLVKSTLAISVFFYVVEVAVRGPLAPQTIAFGGMALLFGYLNRLPPTLHTVRRGTIIGLSAYFIVFAWIEFSSPVAAMGIRCATFAFPVAAILLAGKPEAIAFYGLAVAQTIVTYRPQETPHETVSAALNAVGAILAGAVLLAIAWAFDRARAEAQHLANRREQDLTLALRRAEEAVDARMRFLSNMSHEIRTPMNGVLGLSRLMAAEAESPSMQELAQTVVASGESLLHILDDILDLSKLDAGAVEIDRRPEQPRRITSDVVALMSATSRESGLALEPRIDDNVPAWVQIDGHRWRQILSNLVGNALKFTPRGRVDIHLSYHGDVLHCRVKDTGIGMSPDVLNALFRPFYQADSGTARQFGGTGLGLAICKRLCELMEGQIGAESTVGQGSAFWFAIPAPATQAPHDNVSACDEELLPLRVLVAEDNRVNQLVARRLLESLGMQAKIVDDGAEAVRSVKEQVYDIVLMDRHMPNVDGLTATQMIRQLAGARSRTPIVAVTASVMADDKQACLAAGMDAVIAKPIEISVLKETLRSYGRRPTGDDSLSTLGPRA